MHRSACTLVLAIALAGCGGAETPAAEAGADTATVAVAPESAPTAADTSVMTPSEMPAGEMPVRPADTTPPAGEALAPEQPTPAPTQPSGATSAAANEILERAEQTYAQLRTMSADFVQQVYVPLLETTQRSRGTIFHRAPDGFLMRFSDPAGDLVLADGRYIWMYYPSTDARQVMRAGLSASGQQVDLHKEFLSNATSRFNVTRTGGETIGGRQTHALTLVPRGASPYRQVRLWIDAENSLVRRFEINEENGSVRTIELSNIRLNPTLDEDLFVFEVPPGVQVHDF